MKPVFLLSLICFIGSVICFFVALQEGNLHGGLFVVVPFIIGSGYWTIGGVVLLFLSFLLFSYGSMPSDFNSTHHQNHQKGEPSSSKMKTGGVLFIGPIPILFGKDKKTAFFLMILGYIILSLIVLFFYFM